MSRCPGTSAPAMRNASPASTNSQPGSNAKMGLLTTFTTGLSANGLIFVQSRPKFRSFFDWVSPSFRDSACRMPQRAKGRLSQPVEKPTLLVWNSRLHPNCQKGLRTTYPRPALAGRADLRPGHGSGPFRGRDAHSHSANIPQRGPDRGGPAQSDEFHPTFRSHCVDQKGRLLQIRSRPSIH